jgi:polysaccharide export outer membrane protein
LLDDEIHRWEASTHPVPPTKTASVPHDPAAEKSLKNNPTDVSEKTITAVPAIIDPDYEIRSGDLLNIMVLPTKELNREALLEPDGTMTLPLIGTIQARGMTIPLLERTLTQKYQTYVMRPEVRVSVRRFATDTIFVMGEVFRPGPVPYRLGLKALTAISENGGFTADADRKCLMIHRGTGDARKTFSFDAEAAMSSGGTHPSDFPLSPGDIVEIPSGADNVSILGMVAHPGRFPLAKSPTLLELISDAGGPLPGAKTNGVYIYRQNDAGRESVRVNLARIMKGHPEDDVTLQTGDIVMIPQKALYSGGGGSSVSPWLYLTTMTVALIVATNN